MADELGFVPPSDDAPMEVLQDYTPDQVAHILRTKYDPDIQGLLNTLVALADFSDQEWANLVAEAQERCAHVFQMEDDMTIGKARPYQEVVDLVVLGLMTHEWAERNPLGKDSAS